MVPIPDAQAQADITAKLNALALALESHDKWTPPRPHPTLFHIWDFVKRSHYIMTELDNIRHGRELKHPDQIPSLNSGWTVQDNEEKAQKSFFDVVTRTITINKILEKPSELTMMGMPSIEFNDDIKAKGQAVQDAIMSVPE
ncbi:hypothetical protein ACRE_074870 [Hapsidospora chrysogenum ATCC 11550]|uniref:Uncharacterized protein n=1 Tax=Hapsidospora chrysogenum (strain ATCC 11550 / CBS 779.69 / DSM 880 / IAM 14645 / JCM 23072 / IMI 49137) TaxID=857340 RepID=A0A086SXG1_HAPC1|nr:hypothetical protein ACRE_074870 [Hapsidospora chrysogenum ATCC 11550]